MWTKSSNKVLLEWSEPGTSRRFLLKQIQPRHWLRIIASDFAKWFLGIVAIMVVGTLIFHKLNLIQILAYSALCALPMAAIDIFATVVNPVHISLRENFIVRHGVNGAHRVDYQDVQQCTLRARDFDGTTARGLEIVLRGGNAVILEIAPSISTSAIRSILRDKGIEIE